MKNDEAYAELTVTTGTEVTGGIGTAETEVTGAALVGTSVAVTGQTVV